MITAIYPGSFDPITLGHENIIRRGAKLVDTLYVSPLANSNKKSNVFSIEERVQQVKKVCEDMDNVKVITFQGLLKDYVKDNNITFILKGVRNSLDFEAEFQMATGISLLDNTVETLLIPTDISLLPISSSLVRDLASNKGDLTKFVPSVVVEDVKNRYKYM